MLFLYSSITTSTVALKNIETNFEEDENILAILNCAPFL